MRTAANTKRPVCPRFSRARFSRTLAAPSVRNAAPGVLRPQTYWNAENLMVAQNR
jgi:hypothetical protein